MKITISVLARESYRVGFADELGLFAEETVNEPTAAIIRMLSERGIWLSLVTDFSLESLGNSQTAERIAAAVINALSFSFGLYRPDGLVLPAAPRL